MLTSVLEVSAQPDPPAVFIPNKKVIGIFYRSDRVGRRAFLHVMMLLPEIKSLMNEN
jgi:hypothetical protein